MYNDLDNLELIRRLRRFGADDPGAAPYDWAQFQRRRRAGLNGSRAAPRWRFAAAVLLVVSVAGALGYALVAVPFHGRGTPSADQSAVVRVARCAEGCAGAAWSGRVPASSPKAQGWLARLPQQPTVLPVGTQVAETGLADQIATVDELLSAGRVARAQPAQLAALESQRRQLVGSLAEVRYAELLAAASR